MLYLSQNDIKNVSQLLLVRSGLDSHSVLICRKPTQLRERFAIFSEHYNSSCREMNVSSNKANAYFNLAHTCACPCYFTSASDEGLGNYTCV